MGILDSVMDAWGNAGNGTDRSRDAYLQALAGGMLSGRSNNFGVNLGTSMLGAQGAAASERERMAKEQLIQAQVGHYGQQDASARAALEIARQKAGLNQSVWNNPNAPDANNNLVGQPLPKNWDMQKAMTANREQGAPLHAPNLTQRLPTDAEIMKLQAADALGPTGLALYKQLTDPKVTPAGSYELDRRTGVERYMGKPDDPFKFDGNGGSRPNPGVAEGIARAEGLKEAAQQASKAPYTTPITRIGPDGGTQSIPVPEWAKPYLTPGMGGQQTPTPQGQAPASAGKYGAAVDPEVAKHLLNSALREGVPPEIAFALARQESGFKQSAVSPTGPRGIMQMGGAAAKDMGVNRDDWQQNVDGGIRYLKAQYAKTGNWQTALQDYHDGPGASARGVSPAGKAHADKVMGLSGTGVQPTAQAPASGMVSSPGTAEQSAMNALGKDVTTRLDTGKKSSTQSMRGLGAIDDIITTLDSNKGFAVVGPMTDWAQSAAGALRTMGLEKPAIDAWLFKRGTIIQAEAKLALDGAAAAANQGAISNFERDMIAAAASPSSKLTDPQMRAALVGIQKMHAYTILGHQREYEATAPGLGPLSKTYEVKITPEQRGKYESILAGPRFESLEDATRFANTKRDAPATAGTKPEAAPGADAITRAQDAIRRGAPRDAVIKRLRDAGLPTDGL